MKPARWVEPTVLWVVLLLMAVWIRSWDTIPADMFLGLDIHNLHAFHHCGSWDNPYTSTGKACGDVLRRDMFYPPLLYFLFFWTRWVSLDEGTLIWSNLILLMTVGSLVLWALPERFSRRQPVVVTLFILLLAAQYPSAFAMERGNNDALVLVTWTGATLLFMRERFRLAGVVAGLATALKLYPGIACAVVGGGLVLAVLRRQRDWKEVAAFAAGGVTAVVATCLFLVPQTHAYLADELPRFAAQRIDLTHYAHSLHLVSDSKIVYWSLAGSLFAIWVAVAMRMARQDPALVFAGALAVSTYFSGTSFDYNLLTTYPLLLLLFLRAFQSEEGPRAALLGLLLMGLLAVAGDRAIFLSSTAAMKLHILLQWAFLVLTAVHAVWPGAQRMQHPEGCPS